MSTCAEVSKSFNQTTHPEYNNACVIGNPDLLANAPLKKILSDCCRDPAKFSTDSCYFICSFDRLQLLFAYSQCLNPYMNATIPGLPGGLSNISSSCFGDIFDNYIQTLENATANGDNGDNGGDGDDDTSSEILASYSSLLAALSTMTAAPSKTSATVVSTSSPSSSVTTTGSTSPTTQPSKASSGRSISMGSVVVVGLVFLGVFV